MAPISDFSDSELWAIETALRERYRETIEPQLVDTEVRLRPSDRELTSCPAAYWEREGCHFIVCKTGDQRYRCQFFYRVHQMYGTGIDEFDNITECVVTLLQVQADFDRNRQQSSEEGH